MLDFILEQTQNWRKYIGEYVRLLFGLVAGLSVLLPHFLADLLTHMQKAETSTPEKTVEEEDRVTELPEIPQLQHLAKNRPKRPKKHASSKNVVKVRGKGRLGKSNSFY